MEQATSGIVRPPKTLPSRSGLVARLADFFRGRTLDPSLVEAMRGTVRSGITAVGVAAVIAAGVSGCARNENDLEYGYPVVEEPTTSLPPQVVGDREIDGRYERWDEISDRPGALYLRDAEGGDGYEINWYQADLDAPIPIAPQVMYEDLPPDTEFTVDQFGNAYPADPAVRAAHMATEFKVSVVPLERPEGQLCVDVAFDLRTGERGQAGSFLVDPDRGDGDRVQTTIGNGACPGEPAATVTIPVRELGPVR